MKSLLTFFLGMFTTAGAIFLWVILFFGFDLPFLNASIISLTTGLFTFFSVKLVTEYQFLKKNNLTRKDYVYIQKNLDEAKKKINRLQKAFFSVRTMGAFKQLYELNKLVKRMHSIVSKDPRRFYQSERFFFYHLDSVVELSERYADLAAQPIKNDTIYLSLKETQSTLGDLSESIKKDIYDALSNDIDELNFELDVAKHSLKKLEYNPLDDERSKKE
ncbi:5-bromo-4-chloroindolyl phosphate hydrolysis family protein [Bacillus sp. FJAT-50079]|uniref:5-bromo-4-chloroindolyl phosphate hydrolysis family protein n=1 Tax=Bacillus sp. FJAT-50079 TaxID=2833577 RepID=UPI001BCA27FF|nr:5-bromo-4-chloroindolyl phosphate hydrolysis family protein [Bacillus sp. FJAT-50079]MBS4209685.1 5-bromo-4-chloroindolyl phosphate hydrolysis family protein [Bacillus sp. FJAT-50079]